MSAWTTFYNVVNLLSVILRVASFAWAVFLASRSHGVPMLGRAGARAVAWG